MSKFETFQEMRRGLRGDASKVVEYNVLTVLIGELETAASRDRSEITNDKVIAGIRKLVKSNTETLKLVANPKLVRENAYLETFLPIQLTEDQIRDNIQFEHANAPFNNIGDVMKYLNTLAPGMFDKGVASKVARELFQ